MKQKTDLSTYVPYWIALAAILLPLYLSCSRGFNPLFETEPPPLHSNEPVLAIFGDFPQGYIPKYRFVVEQKEIDVTGELNINRSSPSGWLFDIEFLRVNIPEQEFVAKIYNLSSGGGFTDFFIGFGTPFDDEKGNLRVSTFMELKSGKAVELFVSIKDRRVMRTDQ